MSCCRSLLLATLFPAALLQAPSQSPAPPFGEERPARSVFASAAPSYLNDRAADSVRVRLRHTRSGKQVLVLAQGDGRTEIRLPPLYVQQYGFEPEALRRIDLAGLSERLFEDLEPALGAETNELLPVDTRSAGLDVTYRQAVGGVPVEGTEITYSVGRGGQIFVIWAVLIPEARAAVATDVGPSLEPLLGKEGAVARAEDHFRRDVGADTIYAVSDTALVIYPEVSKDTTLHLAWRLHLHATSYRPEATGYSRLYYVDAKSGDLMYRDHKGAYASRSEEPIR